MQERPGPRPFDVAARHLIEADPAGWLHWLGLPVDGPVQALDSEVSTVLAAVDKVLRVEGPSPWLAHVELQVSRDRLLPVRLLQYHALLLHRHQVPVATTVVLLRQEADGAELTGRFEQAGPAGDVTVTFNYTMVRLWERSVDELLSGGLGLVPLAPLANLSLGELPSVLDRMDERFMHEAPSPSDIGELWAATLLLMGVRYTSEQIRGLGERVQRMRESVTYQMIVEEGIERGIERGEILGVRHSIIELGTEKFGAPDTATLEALERISNLDVLHRLVRATLAATSWQDLLARADG